MSWSRWGNYLPGRFSPFTRSPASGGEVADSAFSYITSEDLKRNAVERSHGEEDDQGDTDRDGAPRHHHKHNHSRDHASRSEHDTDVLILKHRRERYVVHFPAYSIDRRELRIGDIRAAAAKKANSDPNAVKLFYKGRNLKDDMRLALDEGLSSGRESELLCVVGGDTIQPPPRDDSDDDSEDVEGVDDASSVGDGTSKRKKRKSKKKKSAASRVAESNGYATPPPTGTSTFIPPSHIPRSTSSTPAPPTTAPATPATPLDKINKLATDFRSGMVPLCAAFLEAPPSDNAKRDFEYKKLSETIMGQTLLKLDAVEVEGDAEARARRKEVVKEVQGWLNKLDNRLKT